MPEQPVKVGISVADIATGMYAYSGILTALYERERTGVGARLSVAMLDALGEWMMQPVYYSVYGGRETRRTGARHASISPYGPYRAGDGAQVYLSVQSDREWATLCTRVVGRPELVTDPRFAHNPERVAHDDAITAILEDAFAAHAADELVALLDGVGIACARMRTPAEFFTHPQLAARDRWGTVNVPGGEMKALRPPVTVEGRSAPMGDVPALGQHNAAIRAEFA